MTLLTRLQTWRKRLHPYWIQYRKRLICASALMKVFTTVLFVWWGWSGGGGVDDSARHEVLSSLPPNSVSHHIASQFSSPALLTISSASLSSSSLSSTPSTRALCNCGPPSQGRCFMLKCICTPGWTGERCETAASATAISPYGVTSISLSTFLAQQSSRLPIWSSPSSASTSQAKREIDLSALGWLSSLPTHLGHVLEIGSGPLPLIASALNYHARSSDSITIVDPASSSFEKLEWSAIRNGKVKGVHGEMRAVRMRALDVETFLARKDAGTLDSAGDTTTPQPLLYNTIFLSSRYLLSNVRDACSVLEELYQILTDDGVIVLNQRVWDKMNSGDATATSLSTSSTVRINRLLLSRFLHHFSPLYTNDESVLSRLELYNGNGYTKQDKEDALKQQYHYFIGRKLPISQVYNLTTGSLLPLHTISSTTTPSYKWTDHFYLIWSGASFQTWRMYILDSVYKNHPNSTIHIFSNTLQMERFEMFTNAGYKLRIHAWNHTEFFADTPLATGFRILPTHHNFNSHSSDAFRLAVLWKYGGIYIDFDLLILNPLYSLRNTLPREAYRGMVNGALFIMDRAHPFLEITMIHFGRIHNPDEWTSVGPKLQSKLVEIYTRLNPALVNIQDTPDYRDAMNASYSAINIYGPSQFYRHPWQDAKNRKFFDPSVLNEVELQDTLKSTYMFHVWSAIAGGKLSKATNYLHPESFLGRVISANCVVMCEKFRKDNEDLLSGKVAPT